MIQYASSASRREFLTICAAVGVGSNFFADTLYALAATKREPSVTAETIDEAAAVAGIEIPPEKKQVMLAKLNEQRRAYETIRLLHLSNDLPPAFRFDPLTSSGRSPAVESVPVRIPAALSEPPAIADSEVPGDLEKLAFATRCGTTGFRPTFGFVPRTGAMTLAWTMDKLGPICRAAEDCALVMQAIYGPDGIDLTVHSATFLWNANLDYKQLRIGYFKRLFEDQSPSEKPPEGLTPDELKGPDDWPNIFRAARFYPAVEYIQANRARTLAMRRMAELFEEVDIIVAPSFSDAQLTLTNLTGHPAVIVPNGLRGSDAPKPPPVDNGDDDSIGGPGTPVSLTFLGGLYSDSALLAFASAYQRETGFHTLPPPGFVR